jgi:phosphoglycerol transferase MdoB-like AlkP superfamily enzyme
VNTSFSIRRVYWATVWLAAFLVAVKAYYLGLPGSRTDINGYLQSLAAISYVDALFAAVVWAAARGLLALTGRFTSRPAPFVAVLLLAFAGCAAVYAAASVVFFGIFGGFLTYPMLSLVGDVRMLSSSVGAHLTPRVVLTLVAVPLVHASLVEFSVRMRRVEPGRLRYWHTMAVCALGAWLTLGLYEFSSVWATKQDRRIAENPHWVLVSSWWNAMTGDGTVRLTAQFPEEDLKDFEPIGARTIDARRRRPPNVIVVVLESVAARWTSLGDGPYDSTPVLAKESARALVADNFYAHIGRSSNSLAAMLLSAYPKLGFRDITEEYPRLAGTSLASVFRGRGYSTAFVTPSDLTWAEWGPFLNGRGFDDLRDYRRLPCAQLISSWGVEDRCMVDGMIEFITQAQKRPFFVMGWTTQTHHPYEPTPGRPLVEMQREPVPDQYDLDRYLTVLHETDRHLGRLFDTVRRLGLENDTLIVVVGDHGQAFGYPHDTYIQGRTMYEEDVHVPLMFWYPRLYRLPTRSKAIGGHVDLAPTIVDLAGLPPAPDWQGRSLFDNTGTRRAYFYVAEDQFTLGLREGAWKYILNLRDGVDELYDLDRDPDEQRNLATAEPDRSARMRQRLAAWTEANRRQYEKVDRPQRASLDASLP